MYVVKNGVGTDIWADGVYPAGLDISIIKTKTDEILTNISAIQTVINAIHSNFPYPAQSNYFMPYGGMVEIFALRILHIPPVTGLTVKYTMSSTGGGSYNNCSSQIYKNGVAIGTIHTTNVGGTYTETLVFGYGDELEIYGGSYESSSQYISAIQIYI